MGEAVARHRQTRWQFCASSSSALAGPEQHHEPRQHQGAGYHQAHFHHQSSSPPRRSPSSSSAVAAPHGFRVRDGDGEGDLEGLVHGVCAETYPGAVGMGFARGSGETACLARKRCASPLPLLNLPLLATFLFLRTQRPPPRRTARPPRGLVLGQSVSRRDSRSVFTSSGGGALLAQPCACSLEAGSRREVRRQLRIKPAVPGLPKGRSRVPDRFTLFLARRCIDAGRCEDDGRAGDVGGVGCEELGVGVQLEFLLGASKRPGAATCEPHWGKHASPLPLSYVGLNCSL